MTANTVLESDLIEQPRSTLSLAELGVSWRRRAGPDWRRSSRGWYTTSVARLTTTQRIIEAAALLPSHGAVGGWAAAYLHGAEWLNGLDRQGQPVPVPLCVPSWIHRAATPLVRWVRVPPEELASVRRAGVRVTVAARSIADAARWARTEEEALVVLDAARAFGLAGEAAIRAAGAQTSDRRGQVRLRNGLELCSDRVESPWESRLRFCWLRKAELPPLLVNPELVDRRGGWLGRPDLLEPESATVLEFDGDHHRERDQHRADNIREERLEAANLVVVRVSSADLRGDRRPLVVRLRDAHRRGADRRIAQDDWQIRRR